MQPYRKDELIFPGVTIKNVEMDKLITYFEYFLSDISNAVMYDEEELKENSFKVCSNALFNNNYFERVALYRFLLHKDA